MIKSYKDLNVWRKADELAGLVFDITEKFPKTYLFNLTDQLRRSALSIPTNIAEGCASFHSKELLQFLNIARRSLSETLYLVSFAHKRNLITQDQMNQLDGMVEDIGKMINGLANSIRKKSITSTKDARK
jgi:four helix bundle protein